MELHETIEITKDIIISILNHRRGLSNTKSVEFNKLVMREQALHALLSLAQKFEQAKKELPKEMSWKESKMKLKLHKDCCAGRWNCKNMDTKNCRMFPREGEDFVECEYFEPLYEKGKEIYCIK